MVFELDEGKDAAPWRLDVAQRCARSRGELAVGSSIATVLVGLKEPRTDECAQRRGACGSIDVTEPLYLRLGQAKSWYSSRSRPINLTMVMLVREARSGPSHGRVGMSGS